MWGFHRRIILTTIYLSAVFQKSCGFSEDVCKWCNYEWLQSHGKHSSLAKVQGEEVKEKVGAKFLSSLIVYALGQGGRCSLLGILLMTITITTAIGVLMASPNLFNVIINLYLWLLYIWHLSSQQFFRIYIEHQNNESYTNVFMCKCFALLTKNILFEIQIYFS